MKLRIEYPEGPRVVIGPVSVENVAIVGIQDMIGERDIIHYLKGVQGVTPVNG